jgi:hypothetical protein
MCVLDILTHLTFCRAVLYPELTPEEISKRFDNAGPSARHCLAFTPDEIEAFYSTRDLGIDVDTPQRLVSAVLDDKKNALRIGEVSHRLCVVRREGQKPSSFTVGPISAVVRNLLLGQMRKWEDADSIDMIKRFSRVPAAGGMSGMLFESLYQNRFVKKIEIVARPMFRANSRSCWHATFGDFSGRPILRPAHKKALNTAAHPISLSIVPSGLRTYGHHGPPKIDEDVYYIPRAGNEVAIDSFIVHNGHLYLFQITGASKHGVNTALSKTLARYRQLPPSDKWHFIFVIPDELPAFQCPHTAGFLDNHVPHVARVTVAPVAFSDLGNFVRPVPAARARSI